MAKKDGKTVVLTIPEVLGNLKRVFLPDGKEGKIEVPIIEGKIEVPAEHSESLQKAGFAVVDK